MVEKEKCKNCGQTNFKKFKEPFFITEKYKAVAKCMNCNCPIYIEVKNENTIRTNNA